MVNFAVLVKKLDTLEDLKNEENALLLPVCKTALQEIESNIDKHPSAAEVIYEIVDKLIHSRKRLFALSDDLTDLLTVIEKLENDKSLDSDKKNITAKIHEYATYMTIKDLTKPVKRVLDFNDANTAPAASETSQTKPNSPPKKNKSMSDDRIDSAGPVQEDFGNMSRYFMQDPDVHLPPPPIWFPPPIIEDSLLKIKSNITNSLNTSYLDLETRNTFLGQLNNITNEASLENFVGFLAGASGINLHHLLSKDKESTTTTPIIEEAKVYIEKCLKQTFLALDSSFFNNLIFSLKSMQTIPEVKAFADSLTENYAITIENLKLDNIPKTESVLSASQEKAWGEFLETKPDLTDHARVNIRKDVETSIGKQKKEPDDDKLKTIFETAYTNVMEELAASSSSAISASNTNSASNIPTPPSPQNKPTPNNSAGNFQGS
jgi:hypothetical protein